MIGFACCAKIYKELCFYSLLKVLGVVRKIACRRLNDLIVKSWGTNRETALRKKKVDLEHIEIIQTSRLLSSFIDRTMHYAITQFADISINSRGKTVAQKITLIPCLITSTFFVCILYTNILQ